MLGTTIVSYHLGISALYPVEEATSVVACLGLPSRPEFIRGIGDLTGVQGLMST